MKRKSVFGLAIVTIVTCVGAALGQHNNQKSITLSDGSTKMMIEDTKDGGQRLIIVVATFKPEKKPKAQVDLWTDGEHLFIQGRKGVMNDTSIKKLALSRIGSLRFGPP